MNEKKRAAEILNRESREKMFQTIAASADEAVHKVENTESLKYPILVVPWGIENSGADQYIVSDDRELHIAVEKALNDSLYEAKVHLITKEGQGDFWKTSRTLTDPLQDSAFKSE